MHRSHVIEVPEEEEDGLDPDRTSLEPYDAVECDLCELWFHAGCLDWDLAKYRQVSAVIDIVKWFYASCSEGFKKMKEKVTVLESRVTELEGNMERRVNDKITDVVTERMEREKRRNKLIFFGVSEASENVKGCDRADFESAQLRALGAVNSGLP